MTRTRVRGFRGTKWFEIRKLCDGYFITLPTGHDDGSEHVGMFAHANIPACSRPGRDLWR